ncbi:MAG: hypothetical protein IPQ04_10520 [Saprospiraceae bacterium]|nr:hypothetical protein [Saprospiraceae bacterium]
MGIRPSSSPPGANATPPTWSLRPASNYAAAPIALAPIQTNVQPDQYSVQS